MTRNCGFLPTFQPIFSLERNENQNVFVKYFRILSFQRNFHFYSKGWLFDNTPNQSVRPLINYFRLFPSLHVHLSFACRHHVFLVLMTQSARPSRIRQAICSTTHRICTGFKAQLGLKHLPARHFSLQKNQREISSSWFHGVEF